MYGTCLKLEVLSKLHYFKTCYIAENGTCFTYGCFDWQTTKQIFTKNVEFILPSARSTQYAVFNVIFIQPKVNTDYIRQAKVMNNEKRLIQLLMKILINPV